MNTLPINTLVADIAKHRKYKLLCRLLPFKNAINITKNNVATSTPCLRDINLDGVSDRTELLKRYDDRLRTFRIVLEYRKNNNIMKKA